MFWIMIDLKKKKQTCMKEHIPTPFNAIKLLESIDKTFENISKASFSFPVENNNSA